MSANVHAAILIAIMSVGTAFLRFLPFMAFKKHVPSFILYLGKVLPPAIIGMLVIYCLRSTQIRTAPFGLPELIAIIVVVLLQIWRRNALISILSGTVVYMLLVQLVFR